MKIAKSAVPVPATAAVELTIEQYNLTYFGITDSTDELTGYYSVDVKVFFFFVFSDWKNLKKYINIESGVSIKWPFFFKLLINKSNGDN